MLSVLQQRGGWEVNTNHHNEFTKSSVSNYADQGVDVAQHNNFPVCVGRLGPHISFSRQTQAALAVLSRNQAQQTLETGLGAGVGQSTLAVMHAPSSFGA